MTNCCVPNNCGLKPQNTPSLEEEVVPKITSPTVPDMDQDNKLKPGFNTKVPENMLSLSHV